MPKLYSEVKYQRVLRLFENQSDHSKPMIIKTQAYDVWEENVYLKDSKSKVVHYYE